MTEDEVLEALKGYASERGFEIIPPQNDLVGIMYPSKTPQTRKIVEMKRPAESGRRLLVKFELTEAGSAWITFRLLVGEILRPTACIPLFFVGTWPTSNFFLKGVEIGKYHFLLAEIFVFLHKDLSPKQAVDVLALVAQLPKFDIDWPDGVDIY
jgi:hypothetical protein